MGARKILILFIVLSLTYLGLVLGIPPDSASLTKYDLEANEAKLLALTIALPLIGIWFLAYYGYSKFYEYSRTVKESEEGEAWALFVAGLLTLALWLPATTIISNLGSYLYNRNAGLMPEITIVMNYINLVVVFIAFAFLFKGATQLAQRIKKPLPTSGNILGLSVLVVMSSIFAFLALTSSNQEAAVDAATPAAYYLPNWLLTITVIIPYIIVFYLGVRVIQYLHLYRMNVKGILYKSALKSLSIGIGFVVVSLMAIRYFASLTPAFDDAALKALLAVLYMLILLIAAGYGMIALGAKRLQRIEEA